MVATLYAPAGLVKRPARDKRPIFVAARIAERKSRKNAPDICHGGPAVPDHIGRCEGGGYSVAALSVWLFAWRLLFIWVSAH